MHDLCPVCFGRGTVSFAIRGELALAPGSHPTPTISAKDYPCPECSARQVDKAVIVGVDIVERDECLSLMNVQDKDNYLRRASANNLADFIVRNDLMCIKEEKFEGSPSQGYTRYRCTIAVHKPEGIGNLQAIVEEKLQVDLSRFANALLDQFDALEKYTSNIFWREAARVVWSFCHKMRVKVQDVKTDI